MNDTSFPLATIGICTYNRAGGYMPDAVQSAVNQKYPNLEIVISDNCSTDNTEEVIRGFDDPRIRYIRQPRNLGVNGNFNACLNAAEGEYFLLLHDDDLIDEDFIETCMSAVAGKEPVGLIRTGTRVIDDVGRVMSEAPNDAVGLSTGDLFLRWFDRRTAMYFCSTMYHTERLKEVGGFQSKTELFQDVVAVARLSGMYGRVDIPEVKASFRRHGANNGSRSRVEDWAEDSLYLLDVICEHAPEDEEALRREGLPYLCRKNYRQASAIPSSVQRMSMYLKLYRRFGYSYSPLSFILPKKMKRARRAVTSRLGAE